MRDRNLLSRRERLWSTPLLGRLLCLTGDHEPDRTRARHNASVYVAPCLGCGRPLARDHQGWLPVRRGSA